MKLRSILSARMLPIVFSFLFLWGCGVSQAVFIEDHGHDYLARHVDELKEYMNSPESYASKVTWKEQIYPMADGYYGFVEPIGKDCSLHWKVNKRNKLVGYITKGDGCDTTKSSDMELMNLKETTTTTSDERTIWRK